VVKRDEPERVKRNVEDVGYVANDGSERPMREVLRERDRSMKTLSKPARLFAFRVRAGMASMLDQCICCWPIARAPTESEHELWCVSHGIYLAMRRSDAQPDYPDRPRPTTDAIVAALMRPREQNNEPTTDDTKGNDDHG
jgi:hypothetical protein